MTDGLKIFVDDNRFPSPEYDKTFQGAEFFIKWVKNNPDAKIKKLSLDHDLGVNYMDGTQLCQKLLTPNSKGQILLPETEYVQFHTNNARGWKNMYKLFRTAKEKGLIKTEICPYLVVATDGQDRDEAFIYDLSVDC